MKNPDPNDPPVNPLTALLTRSEQILQDLGDDFAGIVRQSRELRQRLATGRIHLAVLGQFKRGKSTFVNALLGEALLPSAVVPLTAIPTFIQHGPTRAATIFFADDQPEEKCTPADSRELSVFLARFVTESGNPENRCGVARVEVFHPAPILRNGLVLIDTPGIGSTFRHNTLATINFLCQCDAAIFVFSVDPPPTEVEIDFLKQVQGKVPRLFFILNKTDYVTPAERQTARDFFQQVLAEQAGYPPATSLFSLSSRQGLEARQTDNDKLWRESGLAAMEEHLLTFMAEEKSRVLGKAVQLKADDLLADGLMRLRLARRSLQMPLVKLEECLAIFDDKLAEIDHQLQITSDILAGEKRRLHEFLEQEAARLRREAGEFSKRLIADIMRVDGGRLPEQKQVQAAIDSAIPEYFGKLNLELTEKVGKRIDDILDPHQSRADELIEVLRQTAAELFDIPYHAPRSDETFRVERRPYWVTRKWSTRLNPLPKSLKNSFFADRRQQLHRQLEEQGRDLVVANIENLRWALFQNIDDAFRRFSTLLATRLQETRAATRRAIATAVERRQHQDETIAGEMAHLEQAIRQLEALQQELRVANASADFTAVKPG